MALVNSESASIGGFGGGFGGGIPFGVPVGGFGGGAGGIDALVLLALLGGRGFGRDGGGDHCHDGGGRGGSDQTAALATVIAALNDRNDSSNCECVLTAILSKLGSVEGQIPAVGAELQLALQGAVASLTAQGNANAAALTIQLNQLQLGQLVQSNAIQTAIAGVDTNVDRQGSETRAAIAASEARIANLITENVIQGLRDDKVILANEVVELRHEHRHADSRRELDGIRINIENTNTAIAAQAQFQQQRQTDLETQRTRFDFERLHSRLDIIDSQFARATNQAVNIGGTQLASPTNTQTNTKL